jgi:fatty acid desaturase
MNLGGVGYPKPSEIDMRAKQLGKTLNSRELNALIHPLRYRDNYRNLLYLAIDYLTLVATLVPAIAFVHMRGTWGLSWAWDIPVVVLAAMLVGVVQHRFAGLGHEGAHYILLRKVLWNELVSDLFCMFPLFSTTAQYRLIHLGHHEYTNDWERDPELLNLGKTRAMDEFPMSKGEFVYRFFIRIFWPPALLRYMWDNIYVTTLGNGVHPYAKTCTERRGMVGSFRVTSLLGLGYLVAMIAVIGYLSHFGTVAQFVVAPVALMAVACAAIAALPGDWFFRSDLKPVYSSKVTSVMRLGWLTALETVLAGSFFITGFEWGVYFWLFWVLPLFTSFPYYMLLRDLYQHANADDGKLTNSRVIFCNPIMRWAMFIYGQDVHLTHHLYPAVPHYNLPALHNLLVENNVEYAEHVVECHGMFWNNNGQLTMLDVVEKSTCEPGAEQEPAEQPTSAGEPRRIATPSMLAGHMNEQLLEARTPQS